jgi:RNase P/RNase MRP subunit p29
MLAQTKVRVFAFDRATSAPVTGGAAAITANWSRDYGARVALTDTNPTEAEDGFYYFDLTTDERDVSIVGEVFPVSSTPGVQVIGVPAFYEGANAKGGSVSILPAVGIVADRSPGVTLSPVVGETISQSITLYQTDGTTPVDVSAKTLAIVFETLQGLDVAVVSSGSITISGIDGNVVTFAYPAIVTSLERTLRFAIRDEAAPLTMYVDGICNVRRAPQVDA